MTEQISKDVKDYLGEEVYTLSRSPLTSVVGPLEIFKNTHDVQEYLQANTVVEEGELRLMHGILSTALSIPKSIPAPLEIFILLPNAYSKDQGIMVEVKNLEILEETINAITQNLIKIDKLSEIESTLVDIDTQKIEDIYIIYGYEINLYFQFDEEETDEQMVDSAKEVYNKIKEAQ